MIRIATRSKIFFSLLVWAGALSPSLCLAQEGASSSTKDETGSGLSPVGLFVEPIISYANETSSIKTSQLPLITDDTSGTTKGYGVGARLGMHVSEVLFFGADGRYARSQFSDSSYGDAEGNTWNLGPVVGVQVPNMGLRVWGTYVMMGEFNPEAGRSGFDLKFRDPRGWRLGAGFRVSAVSLNLEYQDLTYDKSDIESFGFGNASRDTNVDFDSKATLVSLSFPLQL